MEWRNDSKWMLLVKYLVASGYMERSKALVALRNMLDTWTSATCVWATL